MSASGNALVYTAASDPPAGYVGSTFGFQILNAAGNVATAAAPLMLTSGVLTVLGSIALPFNGDYYFDGGVIYVPGTLSLSVTTSLTTSLSATTTNTDPVQGYTSQVSQWWQSIQHNTRRQNLSNGVQTVYILCTATFTLSTLGLYGNFNTNRRV